MPGKSICRLLFLLAACGVAHGQPVRGIDDAAAVSWTVAMVQSCIRVDELLRRICAGAGALPQPDQSKKLCELPAAPFEARTARAYGEFKESWRVELKANEAEVAKAVDSLRTTFEKHYAHMRSGSFTISDLALLSRESTDCINVEKRFLAPARLKK